MALPRKSSTTNGSNRVQGKKEDPGAPGHPSYRPERSGGRQEKKLLRPHRAPVPRLLRPFGEKGARARGGRCRRGSCIRSSGSRLTEKGWTEFYGDYYTPEDVELPKFKAERSVAVDDKKKTKKETKPPKRYTQASIVSELEKRHLGTKSTRSVDSGYALQARLRARAPNP